MLSPSISLDGVAENTAKAQFDSSWWEEDFQTAEFRVEYFDADGASLGENVLFRWESQQGEFFKPAARNETIEQDLSNPAEAASMVLTWAMPVAGNDWWWAIDNVHVTGEITGSASPALKGDGWAFDTFQGAEQSIVFQEGVEITVDGVGTGVTYEGTTDADPAGASPDEVRDRAEINPDGEDGGSEVHGLTAFKNLFGDGPGQIPLDADITKATLTLNITNEGTPLTVHRLLGDFDEEVTWNDLQLNGNTEPGLQADDVEAVAEQSNAFDAPASIQVVDVTGDLELWQSGAAENYGWGFLPTGTNGVDWDSSEASDPAGRPKLTVNYVVESGDSPTGTAVDVAAGTAAQSSQLGGFVAENALDDQVNFTHTLAGDENPTWQVLLPESYAFDTVTIYNRASSDGATDCCPSRLRDITIQVVNFSGDVTADFVGGEVLASSDLLNPENELGGGVASDGPISLTFNAGGAVGNMIRVHRSPDPDLSGTGGAGNDDEGSVLSIDLVEAIGTVASVDPPALQGDIDGDGSVGFSDFLVLSANFGQTVDVGTGGDIDGDGNVAFSDFLVLSANFGQTA